MYIICALISIPLAMVGYVVLPGTINQPNKKFLNEVDIRVASARLERSGHKTQGKLSLQHVKNVFTSKRFWMVLTIDIMYWNANINVGAFLLWLKSLKRYDAALVNEFGSIPPALGVFFSLFATFASDLLWGPVWGITFVAGMGSITNLLLVSVANLRQTLFCGLELTLRQAIWNIPEAAKWVAYCNYGWYHGISGILHGWINNLLRDSPEMRSFTLVFINMIAQSSTAWSSVLAFPTKEAPRFLKGYSFSFTASVLLVLGSHLLNMHVRKETKREQLRLVREDSNTGSNTGSNTDSNTDVKIEQVTVQVVMEK